MPNFHFELVSTLVISSKEAVEDSAKKLPSLSVRRLQSGFLDHLLFESLQHQPPELRSSI